MDEHLTNSDSDDDSQQLRPESDNESRHTLEARIRALDSMIANRAKSQSSKQPETILNNDLYPIPSHPHRRILPQAIDTGNIKINTHETAAANKRAAQTIKFPPTIKKPLKKRSQKTQKTHGTSSTDSSSDDVLPLYSNNDSFLYTFKIHPTNCKLIYCYGSVRDLTKSITAHKSFSNKCHCGSVRDLTIPQWNPI